MNKKRIAITLCVLVLLFLVVWGNRMRFSPVFDTEDIVRITLYGYYGSGKGSDVPPEHLEEVTQWLGSFSVGKKAREEVPPGTNTFHVEIEYADGRVIKNGMDLKVIDGTLYYLNYNYPPDCFWEIISKTSLD